MSSQQSIQMTCRSSRVPSTPYSLNELNEQYNRERIRNLRIDSITNITICCVILGMFGIVLYYVIMNKPVKFF
jgi:uncharacterized protein (DUF2062 family)